MEQHSQDVAQKVMHDKNLESFASHFAKKLHKNQAQNNYFEIMSCK